MTLEDLAREGVRRMIAAALEAEVVEYVGAFVEEVDEDGRRLVVSNGRARERRVTIGSGTVAIRVPRVNDKRIDADTAGRLFIDARGRLPGLTRGRWRTPVKRTTSRRGPFSSGPGTVAAG